MYAVSIGTAFDACGVHPHSSTAATIANINRISHHHFHLPEIDPARFGLRHVRHAPRGRVTVPEHLIDGIGSYPKPTLFAVPLAMRVGNPRQAVSVIPETGDCMTATSTSGEAATDPIAVE